MSGQGNRPSLTEAQIAEPIRSIITLLMRDDGVAPNKIVDVLLYEALALYQGSYEEFAVELGDWAISAIGGPEVSWTDDHVLLPVKNGGSND